VPFVKSGFKETLTRGNDQEAANMQNSQDMQHVCTHRHDLDENGGEVVELRVQNYLTIAKGNCFFGSLKQLHEQQFASARLRYLSRML